MNAEQRAAQSRDTAAQVERHWWTKRLQELALRLHEEAAALGRVSEAADKIDALVRERNA